MPTLVDGSEGGTGTEPTAVARSPHRDQLVGEETKRVRAASDGDTRLPRSSKPKQFSVVAVDESRSTVLLLPSSSHGTAIPAGALQPAPNHTTGNSVNGAAGRPAVPPNGEGEDGGRAATTRNGSDAAQVVAANRFTSVAIPVLTLAAASDNGSPSNSQRSSSRDGDSPTPSGNEAAGATAAASRAAVVATAVEESLVSLVDEQASIGGGVQQRIHYRKLREKASSGLDAAEQTNGNGSAKMERLTIPTAASYHNSLPASGPWNYPPLLGASGAAPRNISTLSLTLLLRDQRRKNLAMLARLFASRQKEKDLLDGTGAAHTPYQDLMTESKKKRCQVTSMQVAVASLFCILLALVTTSVLLFAPNRNIYRSQAGFVFDKDTRMLTVQNSTGHPLLQIRTGVDLRGLPYNCSTPDDLLNRRRCWKWSPSNVTLRVNVVNLSSDLTCVDVTWQTTSVEPLLCDCVALGTMHWYGGASSRLLPWSMNAALAYAARADANGPSAVADAMLYAPGEAAGTLAARTWISTEGALVAVHGYAPLYLRLQGSGAGGPAFCLSSWPGYERGQLHSLNYTACVAADVPTAHRRLIESQRVSAAWMSEDSSAVDGTGVISPANSAVGRDEDGESLPDTAATTTPSLDPDAEAIAATARVAADASSSATAATTMAATASSIASQTRWSSSIVRPDPVWIVRADNGADLLNRVVSHGFATTGTFLVHESSLSDPGRAVEAIERVSRRALALNVTGLSFGLTVSAFVSVNSDLFLDRRYETLWMRTARSSLPVLVRDDSVAGGSASMLVDPASDLAYAVIDRRLTEIASVARNNFSSLIGMLYIRAGIAAADLDLQAYLPAAQERLLSYPLWYARLGADLVSSQLLDSGSATTTATLLVDGATTGLAGYSLPESVQQGTLAEIVRHVLTASVSGDPPSSIGPFAAIEVATSASDTDEMDIKSRYIRWMQLAAFMPVMMFDSPPWEHGEDVVDMARRILAYRKAEVMPRLRRLYEAFGRTGEPVYKPLWWNDSLAATVKTSKLATQFFLDDLMVAPIVDQKPYRLIYFPTGFWLDQGQKLFIGPGIHNYTVDLSSMPCFLRKTTGIHEKGIPEADIGLRR